MCMHTHSAGMPDNSMINDARRRGKSAHIPRRKKRAHTPPKKTTVTMSGRKLKFNPNDENLRILRSMPCISSDVPMADNTLPFYYYIELLAASRSGLRVPRNTHTPKHHVLRDTFYRVQNERRHHACVAIHLHAALRRQYHHHFSYCVQVVCGSSLRRRRL